MIRITEFGWFPVLSHLLFVHSYALRLLEMNAKWVGRVFIVTNCKLCWHVSTKFRSHDFKSTLRAVQSTLLRAVVGVVARSSTQCGSTSDTNETAVLQAFLALTKAQ